MKTNTQITAKDIHGDGDIEIAAGLSIRVSTEHDQDSGPPWEECDGHGPVSDWTTRDKNPGERVISTDRSHKRYYDFAAAMKEAKRDGWDAAPYHAAFPNETKAQKAARAVEADFEYLRKWCADQWEYLCISVALIDGDGNEIARDSLCGVESFGDYWKEQAAEMANCLLSGHEKEIAERAEWEARDTVAKGTT